jgi:hypothetical protein
LRLVLVGVLLSVIRVGSFQVRWSDYATVLAEPFVEAVGNSPFTYKVGTCDASMHALMAPLRRGRRIRRRERRPGRRRLGRRRPER